MEEADSLNPTDEIGVIEALLTGVRSTIPQDILKLYQSTGTIHIMSISGLHVGLLMALLIPLTQGFKQFDGYGLF